MYFQIKNTLKINRYHTQQHPFNKPEKKNSYHLHCVLREIIVNSKAFYKQHALSIRK
jgi:hypothetical protein